MDSHWAIAGERPRRVRRVRRARVYASLNRRREIAMSRGAWDAINKPWNVTLLWDEEARRIGVKYPMPGDRSFFRVRNYGRGGKMRIVRALWLLRQFGIKVDETLVFCNAPVVMHCDDQPMLVLGLPEAVQGKSEK